MIPKALHFVLFQTPIGTCGLVWSRNGIVGVQLPEATKAATRARLLARFPHAAEAIPDRPTKRAVSQIENLLTNGRVPLTDLELDMESVPPFHTRVYEVTRSVAPGTTLTYGELARRAGSPGASRAVGQAMARNPFPLIVPCHRVLASGGKIGGFTANGGASTKRRILAIEGAQLILPGG